jgi:hypothetical protein
MGTLEGACWNYIQSNTEQALDGNRKALEDLLHTLDKSYLQTWKAREQRLIQCYTKFLTNLGQYATSRVEKYNSNIHKVTSHQLSLQDAAQRLIASVNDFFRDFSDELERSRTGNVAGIDKNYFCRLTGSVTKWAIREQIGPQWRRLIEGRLPPCTGAFRQQWLLPCAHDLQCAYEGGYPIAKLMVHPRWWIDGHVPTTRRWQPQDSISINTELPVLDSVIPVDLQKLFYDIMATKNQLPDDAARRYERQLQTLLQKHLSYGHSILEFERLPLGMPDDQPRVTRQKLAIRAERLRKEARRQERAAARAVRDDRILVTQWAEQQDSIGSHITVRPRSPALWSTDSNSTTSSTGDDLATVVDDLDTVDASRSQSEPPPPPLPPSTAPPRYQQPQSGRTTRKRAGTGFYSALLTGDSQEIKRARQ